MITGCNLPRATQSQDSPLQIVSEAKIIIYTFWSKWLKYISFFVNTVLIVY